MEQKGLRRLCLLLGMVLTAVLTTAPMTLANERDDLYCEKFSSAPLSHGLPGVDPVTIQSVKTAATCSRKQALITITLTDTMDSYGTASQEFLFQKTFNHVCQDGIGPPGFFNGGWTLMVEVRYADGTLVGDPLIIDDCDRG